MMCFIKQSLEGTKEFFHTVFCLVGAVRRLLMSFFCLFRRQQVCFICNGRNEKGTVVTNLPMMRHRERVSNQT